MNPVIAGALRQVRIETRIQLLSLTGLSWLFWPAIGLGVLFFLRDTSVMQTSVSLAQLGTPGVIAMYIVTGGLLGIAGALAAEREDGTLLRAKAVPGGIAAHLLGNVVTYGLVALLPVSVILVGAALTVDGVLPTTADRWLLLLGVSVLALVSTMPAGAVLGAVVRGPLAMGIMGMLITASLAISGIFYPLAALPTWLQWVGQALPTYWVGVGLRAAVLPAEASVLELHGSWQLGTMLVMLLTWAVVGAIAAPIALRRMARRQSGSAMSAARERVLTKGY